MDPLTALAAFAPLAVDAGKALIGRFLAPDTFKPATITEWLQMRESDTALFNAVNNAGAGGQSYPWVEAIVKLQRPVVVAATLATWCAQELTMPGGATPAVVNFAAVVGFYLFGDRTLFKSKQLIASATKGAA